MLSNATPLPSKFRLSAIALLSLLILPAIGFAQLVDPAIWSEQVGLNADNASDGGLGNDDAVPEPQSASLSGSSYSIDGSVSFNSPGAPNATADMSASYTSGLSSFLGGSVTCQIIFSFRVVETSPPPITLQNVRVDITASGTADAGGDSDLFSNALATFVVGTPAQPTMVDLSATASNSGGVLSDSFNETNQIILGPSGGANVTMTVQATIAPEVLVSGTSATATAFVDPIIVMADELIVGGGGANYRDHYVIEFVDGYWALGSTPVQPTTWGKIKSLYGN